RDVPAEFFGHADAEPPVRAFGFETRDAANAVDVALHEVTAQLLHRRQRAFEIDARAGFQFAETGAAQRLAGKIGGESASRNIDRGETAAVDGDAARFRKAVGERPAIHTEARAMIIAVERLDGANMFNESGKHRGD